MKILAIDDNKINLHYLQEIMVRNFPDYEILLSFSGEEGIKIAKELHPEVILLDILMPEMNGFEVTNILKNDADTKRIPILLISALGQDTEIRIKGLNSGADGFITKPFNQYELIAQVNILLRIKNAEDLLRKLNLQLSKAEEKERRRIAETLHDSLGQTLSIAFMNLSSLPNENFPPSIYKTIVDTSELIQKAITETRTLTYDLSPPILYELGLVPAIKWKLNQLKNANNITSEVNCQETGCNFPKDDEIVLYRIVNELLSNTIKYAGAKSLVVDINAENSEYKLSIKDDGKGFDYNPEINISHDGGFGLFSIKERLTSFGGRLEIESVKGKGTKAIIILPILKNKGYDN